MPASARDGSALGLARPACEAFEAYRRDQRPANLLRDPAQFWRDVEACYAKDGSYCERSMMMTMALPSMAKPNPEEVARYKAEYLAACNQLAEPLQRCLTAYAIDHKQECEKLRAREELDAIRRRTPRP